MEYTSLCMVSGHVQRDQCTYYYHTLLYSEVVYYQMHHHLSLSLLPKVMLCTFDYNQCTNCKTWFMYVL